MNRAKIGIIGGSGLYRMANLKNALENTLDTPFGKPSDNIITGEIDGVAVAFLARHGRDHTLLPSEVPYRANIYAMKHNGVRYLLSFSAVGSLCEEIAPLHMVIPEQYLDLTKRRRSTFFGHGVVAHVSMAQPVCSNLNNLLAQAVELAAPDVHLHRGGTYLCIEGPQFSSLAESNWYRSMGASVIGMTNMPEAKLAKEAQMAYASLAMVTDYDCWHPREVHVTTELAIANLMKNAEKAQQITSKAIQLINEKRPSSDAHNSLENALLTPIEAIPDSQQGMVRQLLK
jgi:5'-methylthioadenosine phosphorylase